MITSHRRTLLVWSPMLVMLALSAVFAEVVVPGLITRVYDGCGPAVLARLMPRRDLHDVGYYVVKTRKLVREELMLLSLLLFAYTAYRTGWLKRAATSLVEFGSKGTDYLAGPAEIHHDRHRRPMLFRGSMFIILLTGLAWVGCPAITGIIDRVFSVSPAQVEADTDMYHDFSVLTLMEGEQGYPLKLEPLIGDLRQAVLFSGGGLLVFLHLFLQPPSLKDNTAHRVPSYRRLLVLIAALIGSGFLFAVASGCDWDYSVYLKMWGTVLHGENPWRTQSLTEHERNAYGPLFNLLAPTIRVGNFFPKLLFCSSTWAFGVFLLALTFRERAPAPKVVGVALLVFLCPFLWIQILRRGEFDIIPGLLTVAAIHFRVRQRDMLSGLALASAFLFKYYPIAILPFLMLDGQRVRLRLGLVAILGSALGLSLSYLYWGGATFDSLLLASSRPSRHYSIFAFLQSKLSPLRALTGRNNFDQFSLPAMAVAGCLALILCHVRRVPPVPAALIGMLTILMFYKVGYAQYFTVLFLIALYWYAIGQPDWIWEPPVSIVLWSYFVWLQVRLVPIWFLTSYILLGCFCLASAARDRLPGVSGRGAMIVPLASISTLFASQLFMFIVESTGYPADFLGLPLFVLGALMILEIFRRSPVAATA